MYAPLPHRRERAEPVAHGHGRSRRRMIGRQAALMTLRGTGRATQSALVAADATLLLQTTIAAEFAVGSGMSAVNRLAAALASASSATARSVGYPQTAESARKGAEPDGCPCQKFTVGGR
jgi:hypothetical protein